MNQLHILYLVSLLMDMSVAGLTFAIGRRAAELGANAGTLGLLNSAWILPYAALALVSGRISDRFGRRRVALISPLINSIVPVACAFTTQVPMLLALTIVFGIGLGFFWPAVIAWVSDGVTGPQLHRRLTWFGVSWNVGLFLGFGLTGLLFGRWPHVAFYFSAAATVVIGLLLILPARQAPAIASPLPSAGGSERRVGARGLQHQAAVARGRGFRKTAWLANFAVQMATGGVAAIFPQLATFLGINAGIHGGLLAAGRAAALAAVIGLQVLTFWRTRLWPLWVAQMIGVAGILLVGFGVQAWLFVGAFVVMGAVSGYSYQASIFFTLDEMTEKGKGGGFHEAVLAAGYFTGPVLAGWVGNAGSLRTPYFFCAGALAALVAAQMILTAMRRRRI